MKRFKTYFTYLGRNKLFTLVNIGGLAISLMFVILIADMVSRQLTVDKNIKDADRIYLMADEETVSAHYQVGVRLQSRYPEIEDWTSIADFYTIPSVPQGNNENSFVSIKYCFAKKNFFDFFTELIVFEAANTLQERTVKSNFLIFQQSLKPIFGKLVYFKAKEDGWLAVIRQLLLYILIKSHGPGIFHPRDHVQISINTKLTAQNSAFLNHLQSFPEILRGNRIYFSLIAAGKKIADLAL